MADDQRRLDALLRTRLAWFVRGMFPVLAPGEALLWNWHLDAICHALERVQRGEVTRLIIEVPPRSLKSVIGSVLFPAWLLGHDSTRKIIAASYSAELATKHHNDCRAAMRSAFYRRLFPASMLGHGKDSEAEFETAARGYRFATSPGGTMTGRGCDILLLDDIMSASDANSDAKREAIIRWYRNTAYSRLNDKRAGAIVVITQRLHIEDLPGVLRELGGWHVLSLPAIAQTDQQIDLGPDLAGRPRRHLFAVDEVLHPAREPQTILDDLRRTLGVNAFSAQYLQDPVPADGALVRWSWFQRFDGAPPVLPGMRTVQSWDIAMSEGDGADWSVCTTWVVSGANYYLIDLTRGRWGFPVLLRKVGELARKYRANSILIEDAVAGKSLIQQLRYMATPGVPLPIACRPEGDKKVRFSAETPAIEAGHVFLPANAPWLDELRREVAQFPNGRHDDQVDSIAQFLKWIRGRSVPSVRVVRVRV